MKFQYVNLGQTVLKYQVPYDIYRAINLIYEKEFKNFPPANETLIGKIQREASLYYNGIDSNKIQKHNFLTYDILHWFENVYRHYLEFNHVKEYELKLQSIWINEMKEHEYNPVHVHRGTIFTGLSSVMILDLPDTYGVEYSAKDKPQNGSLAIIGSAAGQFAKTDYSPAITRGDFFVFPYDMRHCVYPFNGTNQTRRTLAANCDVDYNPIANRGAHAR
jgi:hypothetical protein